MFKRLGLALFLALSGTLAHAAPPPPVPPIADADRYQSYNLTSPTSTVNVTFPVFGDCTDLIVQITQPGGTAVPLVLNTDFTCASTSGGSNLALLPLPITDLVITFSATPTTNLPSGPPSSGFLEVIGKWHPRAVVQPTAPGISRREFNQSISTLIAAQREFYRYEDSGFPLFFGSTLSYGGQVGSLIYVGDNGVIQPIAPPTGPNQCFVSLSVSSFAWGTCGGGGGGEGNVSGPTGGVASGDLAAWDGISGTLIKDSKISTAILPGGFPGAPDGATNNYTAMATACTAGGRISLGVGTYLLAMPSGTSQCVPPTGLDVEGIARGLTKVIIVVADTAAINIFPINANHIAFRHLTIQVQTPTGGTAILFNMENSDDFELEDADVGGTVVEGIQIGGTATVGDKLNIPFLRNGTTTTVQSTITAGQTPAQMAAALVTAINTNTTISGDGIIATATGSFVEISQPSTLIPQASYATPTVTGTTETLTDGFSNTTVLFNNQSNGDEADDITLRHVYLHDILYTVLKTNGSTQTNRRWRFYDVRCDRVFAGCININSPVGVFDDVDESGISIGATGLNFSDSLPIGAAHVTDVTIRGVRARGTYDQNVFHFEQGTTGLILQDDVALVATSGNAGVGYNGTCLFITDNDIGGTAAGLSDDNYYGVTCHKLDGNSQGYGVWSALSTVASGRNDMSNIIVSGWPGCFKNDGMQEGFGGNFVCTNFGASTGTTAATNGQNSGFILGAVNATNYATVITNTGGATRSAACTGTSC